MAEERAYPPPPWLLRGEAVLLLRALDVERARVLMPKHLPPAQIFPGKTLGGIYYAHYGAGSSLEYHELAVVPGFAWVGGKPSGWISHMYVDDPQSIAGGRDIWALPKDWAAFTTEAGRVRADADGRSLCEIDVGAAANLWRQPLRGYALSADGPRLLQTQARFSARLGIGRARISIPPTSPLAELQLSGRSLALCLRGLSLQVAAPSLLADRR